MSSRKFAFEKGGKKRLEIVQPMFSSKRIIKIDGKEVGEIKNRKALDAGWELKSKSGISLTIRSHRTFMNSNGIDVRFNGKPVPGSDSNPEQRLSYAWQIVYFVGAANLALGILTTISPGSLSGTGYIQLGGYSAIVAGIGYLVVGFFIQRRSKIALGFAIIAMILDGLMIIMAFPSMIATGGVASSYVGGLVGGSFIRLIFLVMMFKGFSAINELNAEASIAT